MQVMQIILLLLMTRCSHVKRHLNGHPWLRAVVFLSRTLCLASLLLFRIRISLLFLAGVALAVVSVAGVGLSGIGVVVAAVVVVGGDGCRGVGVVGCWLLVLVVVVMVVVVLVVVGLVLLVLVLVLVLVVVLLVVAVVVVVVLLLRVVSSLSVSVSRFRLQCSVCMIGTHRLDGLVKRHSLSRRFLNQTDRRLGTQAPKPLSAEASNSQKPNDGSSVLSTLHLSRSTESGLLQRRRDDLRLKTIEALSRSKIQKYVDLVLWEIFYAGIRGLGFRTCLG